MDKNTVLHFLVPMLRVGTSSRRCATLRVIYPLTRTRYRFLPGDTVPYFITAITVNWLPLFGNPDITLIILDSLRYLISCERISLHAYVIMENHLHLIASAENLTKEIANFGRKDPIHKGLLTRA